VFFNNQRVEPRSRYSYDALYRLIKASGRENHQVTDAPDRAEAEPYAVRFPISDQALRNYSQSYAYDAVGNILEIRHRADGGNWTRQSTYATNSNRLLRSWTGDGRRNAVDVRYDGHGSMLNLANTPEAYGLRWDYRDMIHRVNLGGGGMAYYSYDAGKQRSRKRIEHNGNRVEELLYLGGMELYRRWLNGSLVEEIETHHLFAGEQRLLIVEDVQLTDNPNLNAGLLYRYQYGNHLGSVSLELTGDVAPQVISYEEYHPYGTTAYRARNAALRATAKRYRYTGMERDEETGLSYHTARYYLPWLGRWGSVDPIGLRAGVDLFAFSKANPIRMTDKSGLQSQPADLDLRVANIIDRYGLDDFAAGFGNAMSFGSLEVIRNLTGIRDTVDTRSADYSRGQLAAVATTAVIAAPAGAAAAGTVLESTVIPIAQAVRTGTITFETLAAVDTTFEVVVGATTEPGEVPEISPSPAQEIAQSARQVVRRSTTVALDAEALAARASSTPPPPPPPPTPRAATGGPSGPRLGRLREQDQRRHTYVLHDRNRTRDQMARQGREAIDTRLDHFVAQSRIDDDIKSLNSPFLSSVDGEAFVRDLVQSRIDLGHYDPIERTGQSTSYRLAIDVRQHAGWASSGQGLPLELRWQRTTWISVRIRASGEWHFFADRQPPPSGH